MNLDNIMFIIIFLLLIVILGFLYYMSNNIKKNQNKINILESDVNALRERLGVQNEKMNSIDTYLNKDMLEKKSSKMNSNNDPVDFSNFLERISSMNGGMMNGGNEYSEEDSTEEEEESTEEEDSDDSNSNEESSVDEEDDSTQYETEDSSSEEEVSEEKVSEDVSIDDNVKSELSKESVSEPEPVKVVIEEVIAVPKKEESVLEEKPFVGIDDLMDDKALKKMPTASIKKLDLGTVMLGGDGKTKYIVALNKSGKKYWKRN
jgi:cobalamin biosynthesis protein CobT